MVTWFLASLAGTGEEEEEERLLREELRKIVNTYSR